MIDHKTLIDVDELDRYESAVQAMLAGDLDSDRFQSIRLQQGIYGQRQSGVNMIRIKIPGGIFNSRQARTIAAVLDQYSSHETAHITTRQSIQVHYVPLDKTPKAIRQLATAGLTTREACNNTIRNISACPLAGVCPSEHTDITRILEQATAYFLRHPLTQHLPRKFKISFSGCEQDCAQGMIHDLAIIAVNNSGQHGFKILAGGGLGHKPHEAITVDAFVLEKDLLASMEAVISVHNRYSDRRYRAKSRIKFLVDRFSRTGFIKRYHEELHRTRVACPQFDTAQLSWHNDTHQIKTNPGAPRDIFKQKQINLNCIPVHIPLGGVSSAQLNGLADIMDSFRLSSLRTSQDQNLIIQDVPDNDVDHIITQLVRIKLHPPSAGSNIVSCPGTTTCRLGITSSMSLAGNLSGGESDLRLRVSGCHNGCAQPETGDIGLYGEGKRLHGRLIPHYQIYIGGDGRAEKGLGFKSRSIPAARIEQAVELIKQCYHDEHNDIESFYQWSHYKGSSFFEQLLSNCANVDTDEIDTLILDHGDSTDFHVVQFGGGECAGAAQETIAALFAEATHEANYRNAFSLQNKHTESIECAEQSLRLIGQALLFASAEPPLDNLSDISLRLKSALNNGSDIAVNLETFATTLSALQSTFDQNKYTILITDIDRWSHTAAAICQEIDQQLDLSTSLNENNQKTTKNITTIDLSTFGCPLHYIKARNTLRSHQSGDVINFIFANKDLARQASNSLKNDGHILIDADENESENQIKICKTE